MLEHTFGPSNEWPHQDLVAFSDEFDTWLAMTSYRCGVFPMPLPAGDFGGEMGWWSPMKRGVLPLEGVRVTRSLRQSARRYVTTIDADYERVLRECANPDRPGGWITDDIIAVYLDLHAQGVAHSVETWDEAGRLVGGLYGVSIGGLFAGESMFHDAQLGRDSSKVALLRLIKELLAGGCELLDVQWCTPHLKTLGAISIDRDEYLVLLAEALHRPHMAWPSGVSVAGIDLTR